MVDSVKKLNELLAVLGNKKVYIQTHNYPDPDAVSSAFGLQYLLRLNGIDADILYCGKIVKSNLIQMISKLNIQLRSAHEVSPSVDDYVITIDGQKMNSNFTDIPGYEIACIDHHPWSTKYEYDFVDHRLTGACATIICDYFNDLEIPIPTDIATALLYGLKMDTNKFTRGVTPMDIEAYSLLHKAADHELISLFDNNDMNLSDLKIFGQTINNIDSVGRIGFARIPFDCSDGLIGEISDFILAVDTIDVAVIYAIRSAGIKLSIRSELTEVNAGKLVSKALEGIGEGGGHATMAGGFIPASIANQLGSTLHKELMERFTKVVYEFQGKK